MKKMIITIVVLALLLSLRLLHTMQQARENNLSLKKYKMYLILSTYDQTITVEACHNFTMRELRDMINKYGEYER